MDNCFIHHTKEVVDGIEDTGAILYFLPSYSPDYNTIENTFSKVKTVMKSMELEMQALEDIDTIIHAAFSSVSSNDCKEWIKASDIYSM